MIRNLFRTLALVTALVALSATSTRAQLITGNPDLPPLDPARYLSVDNVHTIYGGGALTIVLKRPEHFAIVCRQGPAGAGGLPTRMAMGADEQEDFCSEMRNGMVSVNNGPDAPASATEFVPGTQTKVFGKVGNTTGTFDTEMLAMNMQGFAGAPYNTSFMIRESPTRASTGRTTIADIGGGMYRIDSFFDIFTELSIDGGATWMPSVDASGAPASTHVTLVPEPSSFVLAGLGLVGVGIAAVRRRRNK